MPGCSPEASFDRPAQGAPCASPISDVPRRRLGDRRAGLQCPAGSSRGDRGLPPRFALRRAWKRAGAPSVVSDPARRARSAPNRCVVILQGDRGMAAAGTVITSEPPPCASAHRVEISSVSLDAGGSPCSLPDGLGARCTRPTSAYSRLRTRIPRPAHHPAWVRQGAGCFTDSRPASGDRAPERTAEPLASPSPPRFSATDRSRGRRFLRGGRARRRSGRVTDRTGRASRDAFHRARTLAPRRPLERPARAFHAPRDGRTSRGELRDAFSPGAGIFRSPSGARSPCTRPLPAGSRF